MGINKKEEYAIVWGYEWFHQFIYGRKITIESDHKPLEYLYIKKAISIDTPLRLQRMRVRHSITFKKDSLMYITDTFSRAFIENLDVKWYFKSNRNWKAKYFRTFSYVNHKTGSICQRDREE